MTIVTEICINTTNSEYTQKLLTSNFKPQIQRIFINPQMRYGFNEVHDGRGTLEIIFFMMAWKIYLSI
jgi:hypothetical protein